MSTIVNSQVVADKLGVTKRRVEQLVHAGMPRAGRGKYDLEVCLAWVADNREDRKLPRPVVDKTTGNPIPGASAGSVNDNRAAYYAAQTALLEHRLKEQRREVVRLTAVETAVTNMVTDLLLAGDAWVDQAPSSGEMKQRQAIWWDLRDRLDRAGEAFCERLEGAQAAHATGLRNRRQVG